MYKSRAPLGPRSFSFAMRPRSISSHEVSSTGLKRSRKECLTASVTPACDLDGACDQKNLALVGRLAADSCPSVLWVSAYPAKSDLFSSDQAKRCLSPCRAASAANSACAFHQAPLRSSRNGQEAVGKTIGPGLSFAWGVGWLIRRRLLRCVWGVPPACGIRSGRLSSASCWLAIEAGVVLLQEGI